MWSTSSAGSLFKRKGDKFVENCITKGQPTT